MRNQRLADARAGAGLTQDEVAGAVSRLLDKPGAITGHHISKLERGVHRWPHASYRRALRELFGVETDAELGFYDPRTASRQDTAVDRRSFLSLTPALAAGLPAGEWATEFLARIDLPARAPSLVGRSDVAQITRATQAFKSWDRARGGELSVHAVAGQLRWAASLLQARTIRPGVCDDLHAAVAHLAQVLAWMVVDCGEHDAAARYFEFAVQCATESGRPGLRSVILSTRSRHLFWLGRHAEALAVVELAQERAAQLTGPEQAMLGVVRARALAQLGRGDDTRAAIGHAEDQFAGHDAGQNPPPPWMEFFDRSELSGDAGHALADLALYGADPGPALDHLGYAVASHGAGYNRARAFCALKAATLWMRVDPGIGVRQGLDAVAAAEPLRSGRIRGYLRDLSDQTSTHADAGGDAQELQHAISGLAGGPGR